LCACSPLWLGAGFGTIAYLSSQEEGFKVEEVRLIARPDNRALREYSGRCPVRVVLRGRIRVRGGSGTVAYELLTGPEAPITDEELEFDEETALPIRHEFTIQPRQERVVEHIRSVAVLSVVSPSDKTAEAPFTVECLPRQLAR
jgi:hypothetical protein